MSMMKSLYALSPYHVGNKNGRSLVVVLPAAVVQAFGLSPETILALRPEQGTKKMTLEPLVDFGKL
jgi:hypothetical protein